MKNLRLLLKSASALLQYFWQRRSLLPRAQLMRKTKYIIICKLHPEARLLIRSHCHEFICGLKVEGPASANELSQRQYVQSSCVELVRVPHIERPILSSDSITRCECQWKVTVALCPSWLCITFEVRDGAEILRMS